jgi:outer membrane protein assembly factor BamB
MYAMSSDGEKVLVPSDSGLLCLDREGKEIWKSNLARIQHPPTVGAGVCFANNDDGIYALDMRNGKVIWSHSSNERFPTGLSLAGEMIYTTRMSSIVALRAVDGSLAWEAAPTEGGQFLFSFSSVISTANLLLIGGGFKRSIFAFSREGGELVWEHKTGDQVHCNPALRGKDLLIGSHDGNYYCFQF